ncbi:MAG: hypothetical protein IKJ48_07855 [Alistipes sp.]|nr:hypothetical protein [Alistipes sp.]
MKHHIKVGIYATVASIVLAAVAIVLLNLIPSFDNLAEVATIFGAIMATGFSMVSAIIAVVAFLDR